MGIKQIILTCLGIALILVGVPLLVLPGPGLLVIAAGIGIIISQFRRRPTGPPEVKKKSPPDPDEIARKT